MRNIPTGSRMISKRLIDKADYDMIHALQKECEAADQIAMKLELDYKLADAENSTDQPDDRDLNEFLYCNGERLIGYFGICGFGGAAEPLELTGMVHPAYRRRGIFTALFAQATAECSRRNAGSVLGLCDRSAAPGQEFLKKAGAAYHHSEFEMVLHGEPDNDETRLRGITLRKAVNADAGEIARQDRIYFADEFGEDTGETERTDARLPEEEEKRGFAIYLAEKDGLIIGKVNLQLIRGIGGIYGLGVLPEERGHGYGRAILLHAVKKLLDANADKVLLQVAADNDKALNLYKSCGFETTSIMDYYSLVCG